LDKQLQEAQIYLLQLPMQFLQKNFLYDSVLPRDRISRHRRCSPHQRDVVLQLLNYLRDEVFLLGRTGRIHGGNEVQSINFFELVGQVPFAEDDPPFQLYLELLSH
jgi:hypothetical protein